MSRQYDSRTAEKFVMRLPPGLRAEVEEVANAADTSMNTVFIQAVRQHLDGQRRLTMLLNALDEAVGTKTRLLLERLDKADQRADDLETELAKVRPFWKFISQGFNTLECSDKFQIVSTFQSREAAWSAYEALVKTSAVEACQFPQSCTTMCDCNKARRRMDALGIDKDIDTFSVCLECWGTGSICTGILEASNTQCNACDGTGREKQP